MLIALCGSTACAGASRAPPSVAREPAGSAANPLAPSDIARAAAWRYSAPADCPGEERLFEQIAERVPALTASDVASAVSSGVDIEVEKQSSDWRGRVSFESTAGTVAREVTGADCDEVVVALALITSLWLRPRAAPASAGAPSSAGAPPSADAASPADEATPAAKVAAQRSAWAESAARADAPDAMERLARASDLDGPNPLRDDAVAERSLPGETLAPKLAPGEGAPESADDPSAATRGEGGDRASEPRLQLAGLVGYASQPAGALTARLQLERWGSASVSSWGAALGVGYAQGQHENDHLGGAALRLFHGQIELCPPGLDVASSAWARACAHGRAGALHFSADTGRVPDARSLWRPWAALGASLHVGVPLSASLSLRLLAELSLVLVRDEFATRRPLSASEPSPADVFTFYEIRPISFDAGLGAAHVF